MALRVSEKFRARQPVSEATTIEAPLEPKMEEFDLTLQDPGGYDTSIDSLSCMTDSEKRMNHAIYMITLYLLFMSHPS